MDQNSEFDLRDFMPYLLNQAADVAGQAFQQTYKAKYGLLRTDWRVIFHLGRYGQMTAKEICERARLHKTKVSRAVRSLETKRYISRKTMAQDRRHEMLELTKAGVRVYEDLYNDAKRFDADLMADFSAAERQKIRDALIKLAKF